MPIQTQTFVVTDLSENCYIVWDSQSLETVVVDPGGEPQLLLEFIRERGLRVRLILNTHGHIDHVGANAAMRAATGAPIGIHPEDAAMLSSRLLCGADWLGMPYEEHESDFLLEEGEDVVVPREGASTHHQHPLQGGGAAPLLPGSETTNAFTFQVTHVPGHSPGSVMLYLADASLVLSGDLVFRGGVGRWDLPGGNGATLMKSIAEKFLALPDETRVLPGHGPQTTVGEERRSNPYILEYLGGRL